MSRQIDEIRRKFSEMFADGGSVFPAVVTEVNEADYTCTVRVDNAVDYYDVRLRSVVSEDLTGFAFIPKTDSKVLVCRIGKSNELFVCLFSEIDKILFDNEAFSLSLDSEKIDLQNEKISITVEAEKLTIDIDGTTIETAGSGVVFNGGTFGGMVKIKELENNLKALKDYVEAINTALPTAFTAVGASTAASGPNGATSYKGSMSGKLINFSDMENDKVQH